MNLLTAGRSRFAKLHVEAASPQAAGPGKKWFQKLRRDVSQTWHSPCQRPWNQLRIIAVARDPIDADPACSLGHFRGRELPAERIRAAKGTIDHFRHPPAQTTRIWKRNHDARAGPGDTCQFLQTHPWIVEI